MILHALLAAAVAAAGPEPADSCALAGPDVQAAFHGAVVPSKGRAPLRLVADVRLPGPSARFDYQSLEPGSGRLFIAHMGAGRLILFDVRSRKMLADPSGFPTVTGVLAVPREGRVYASSAGAHALVVVDDSTLEVRARVPGPRFPDGIAYDPDGRRVFVSDESGRADYVLDARTDSLVARIDLGGEVGNTRYDPGSGCIIAAVQTAGRLAVIDPATTTVVRRIDLDRAVRYPHGVYIDADHRLAFVAGAGSGTLGVLDLRTLQLRQVLSVGRDPDVLDLDPALGRLYVAAESGVVTVFGERGRTLVPLGRYRARGAHTVAVDPTSHRVYLPLASVGGRPVLRILTPVTRSVGTGKS